MSSPWIASGPMPALRMLLLMLVLAVLAGCGQKGDLYRPGKSQKLAADFAASSPV